MASSAARATKSGLLARAMELSAPKVSRLVIATGPVCKYGEETKKAATSSGNTAA
jgi:hypothetical protein